ncbi:sulfite exporter TauE/SafE family protein [Defluviimonas sp. WL0002]|uniref:Probable membrane transporter protein n=1 Tax=Albidovulum marisflavi TaxID=2984159 RepID=A0ABT2ZGE3_9RHOB|nr:sulfite exporter TauE/SafE family protein [Defluviimonas sp. WL0002]MCV2870210.1 sulfite exporter TauE/SafE family protein [Defluviimonas sp. WL0002]
MEPILAGSPLLLAAVLGIVFFAAIVQAGLGMGFGLAAAPLLALLDPELVPAPALILGFASSLWVALQAPPLIQWREVWTGTAGRIAGVALAATFIAGTSDPRAFSLAFAGMIGLAVVLSAAGWRLRFSMPKLVALAALSGLMGTLTSVGAPPLALIYKDRPPREARATLAAFFTLGCAASLAGLWGAGRLGWGDAGLAALMAPAMVAGLWTARRFDGIFDRRYRGLMLAASALAAVLLTLRAIL